MAVLHGNISVFDYLVNDRDMGIIQYLLDNINDESVLLHRDEDGWNAFAYACAFGTLDIIKALIQKYPDFVNWKNPYGQTDFTWRFCMAIFQFSIIWLMIEIWE